MPIHICRGNVGGPPCLVEKFYSNGTSKTLTRDCDQMDAARTLCRSVNLERHLPNIQEDGSYTCEAGGRSSKFLLAFDCLAI